MTKEGMDWLIRPFYELTIALFRCCEHINQRNPQNIAALKNESIFIVNEKKEGASCITTHLQYFISTTYKISVILHRQILPEVWRCLFFMCHRKGDIRDFR